ASARLVVEEQGVLKGKFGYMSPEQARGERVDRRSDLYSLGVILWECLAGRPLHGGLGGEALLDIVRSGTVEPPSTYVRDIPDELETIVLKLLSPKPEDRPATGRDVAGAIGRAALTRQVLVDGAALESTIEELAPRDLTVQSEPSEVPAEEHHRTQAAAPAALSNPDGPRSPRGSQAPKNAKSAPPAPGGSRRPEAREVRHVAIVTLRLAPQERLDDAT